MPPRTEILDTFGSVTLSAAGAGTVTLSPDGLTYWDVTTIAVHVSSNTSEPTAQVYIGAQDAGRLIGATYTGSLDSSDGNWRVNTSQPLICARSGGDAGATATLSVLGTRTYPA